MFYKIKYFPNFLISYSLFVFCIPEGTASAPFHSCFTVEFKIEKFDIHPVVT